MLLECGSYRGGTVDCRYRFVAEAVELVEQQLDVGRDVVGYEYELAGRIAAIGHIRERP